LYSKVSLKYLGSSTAFEFLSSNRGAISLLHRIEDGLRFDDDVYKRKLNGTWTKDDFESKV
jgi:hypothetical protein